jgi:hypothetical protein
VPTILKDVAFSIFHKITEEILVFKSNPAVDNSKAGFD